MVGFFSQVGTDTKIEEIVFENSGVFFISCFTYHCMMDKSWMTAQKWTEHYVNGVQAFMEFVADHMGKECVIRCPCIDCLNLYIKSQDAVHSHLLI